MDPRIEFFQSLIRDRSKRILELGPLNRPIADKSIYPNTFYCDIRSTEEVKALYSGNDYLVATGIMVDTEEIIPIDYVVKDGYSKSLSDVEKFDCVIASHVMEHVDDLIFSLQDIAQILKPGGIFYIVYPDKRYCFDHFRTSASFRDAYHVFRNGAKNNAPMVLDFYYSVVPENNPFLFWKQDEILSELPRAPLKNAVEHYERALNGERMDDVHYWPFTDMDFLKFLYDCIRAELLPFRCISFRPCAQNDQQFMLALQLDETVLSNPERALKELRQWMKQTLPDYYSMRDIRLQEEKQILEERLKAETIQREDEKNVYLSRLQELETLIQQKENEKSAYLSHSQELEALIQQKEKENECLAVQVQDLESECKGYKIDIRESIVRIQALETIEQSRIWRMTKPLRRFLDFLKGVFRHK